MNNGAGMPLRLVIISVPPKPLLAELDSLRGELCRLSGSKAALAWPAHLTLRTGALVPPGLLKDFTREFGAWVAEIPAFEIRLGKFVVSSLPALGQAGGGRHFAGFEVEPSPALLEAHRLLVQFEPYKKGEQYAYTPHVTMAFDDLDDNGAAQIRQAVAGRDRLPTGQSWQCRQVECYALREGQWQVAARLPLKGR